jgi:hypothetical protein
MNHSSMTQRGLWAACSIATLILGAERDALAITAFTPLEISSNSNSSGNAGSLAVDFSRENFSCSGWPGYNEVGGKQYNSFSAITTGAVPPHNEPGSAIELFQDLANFTINGGGLPRLTSITAELALSANSADGLLGIGYNGTNYQAYFFFA